MLCALLTSAKHLAIYLKHTYSIIMQKKQGETPESRLQGVAKGSAENDDANTKGTLVSDSPSHREASEHNHKISSVCVVSEDNNINDDSFI